MLIRKKLSRGTVNLPLFAVPLIGAFAIAGCGDSDDDVEGSGGTAGKGGTGGVSGSAGMTGKDDPVPHWVVVACYVTIGLGTMFGGWRIVKTMGQRITKVRPVGGFCAELSGSITLFLATGLGIPVSTTQTIAGAIVGVGSVQSVSAVRWGIAGNIVWAWILTIPCSAFMAAIAWWLGQYWL